MNISIKEKQIKGGNRSLYLEYYDKNFRKRESLKLYLIPDDAPNASRLNAATLKRANEILSERILNPQLLKNKEKANKGKSDAPESSMTWLQWCSEYLKYSQDCGNCPKMIFHKGMVVKRITKFLKKSLKRPDILLKDVDKEVIRGLFQFMSRQKVHYSNRLGGKLQPYSLWLFEETVKALFNKAIREGLITVNPVLQLPPNERFHAPNIHREALSKDELERFLAVETATENERTVQLAFGFSCMTGLRLGDMQRLRWSDIRDIGGVKMVSLIQHKTNSPVNVPLNALALSLLPTRENDKEDGLVFHLVKKPDGVAKYVRRIAEKAGIEKKFTYHSSRHTAASLAITAGAELYTVGKILGHKDLRSTQVYAKVDIGTKVAAVNLVNGVFQ